jgi:hypothetical protein
MERTALNRHRCRGHVNFLTIAFLKYVIVRKSLRRYYAHCAVNTLPNLRTTRLDRFEIASKCKVTLNIHGILQTIIGGRA